jgi:ribosomal protein S18 acetylase RimI-like enzyme
MPEKAEHFDPASSSCYDASIQASPWALRMSKLTYFKRYRMELDLRHPRPPAELPHGFYWLPWWSELLELHARVKSYCFFGETDAQVFPCLSTLAGCRDLMTAIVTRPGFCPGATWLVAGKEGCVATVQGLLDSHGYGGVQNLGVVSGYRGLGIGKALLLKALGGFAAVGARRAFLEVTATNEAAIRMYRMFGFRSYKTIYRGVELQARVPDPVGVGI